MNKNMVTLIWNSVPNFGLLKILPQWVHNYNMTTIHYWFVTVSIYFSVLHVNDVLMGLSV